MSVTFIVLQIDIICSHMISLTKVTTTTHSSYMQKKYIYMSIEWFVDTWHLSACCRFTLSRIRTRCPFPTRIFHIFTPFQSIVSALSSLIHGHWLEGHGPFSVGNATSINLQNLVPIAFLLFFSPLYALSSI